MLIANQRKLCGVVLVQSRFLFPHCAFEDRGNVSKSIPNLLAGKIDSILGFEHLEEAIGKPDMLET